MLKSNIPIKATAIGMALIVWLYVGASDKIIEKWMTVPLQKTGLDNELALVTVLSDKVDLQVTGPLSRVRLVEEANREGVLKAQLDLHAGVEGTRAYPIKVTGANMRWLKWRTTPGPRLEVEIEPYAITTAVPERYIVGGLQAGTFIQLESGLPENVTVRGARSLIASLDRVVYRLTESDLVGYGKIKVDFIAQNAEGRDIKNLTISPASAEIEVDVRKSGSERDVPVVYNLTGSPPAGYTVTDVIFNPKIITIEGPSDLLRDVTRIEMEPVDLSGHDTDYTIPSVRLINPDPQLRLSQDSVALEIKIAQKTAQRIFEDLTPVWDGGEEQFMNYSCEPKRISVTVSGPIDMIGNLTREMIIPMINVRNLAEGTHEDRYVNVQIRMPDISLVEVVPETVTVTVKRRDEFPKEGDSG